MCKVLMIPTITPETNENAWKFIKSMARRMGYMNSDGLGYAAFDSEYNLFSEKWLKNSQAFDQGMWTDEDYYLLDILGQENVKEDPVYDVYGTPKRDDMRAMILHARKATCGVTLNNVHPFVKDDIALIHNGMVYNHEKLKKEMSTCDSETILQSYLEFDVPNNPEQIHGVVEEIKAYFACGVLGKDDKENPFLDIFKSPSAELHCTYINELQSIVFSTDKTDLQDAIKEFGWRQNLIFEFMDDVYIRLDLLSGKAVTTFPIEADESYVKESDKQKTNPKKNMQVVQGMNDDDTEDPTLAELINRFADDVDWKQMMDDEYDERNALTRSQIT